MSKILEKDYKTIKEKILDLKSEEIVMGNQELQNTGMVISVEDSKSLQQLAKKYAQKVSVIVQAKIPRIKQELAKVTDFSSYTFEEVSFFILSDVMFDSWQIDLVEKRYLGAKRPLRNGRRYYYSLQELKNSKYGTFRIYGNTCANFAKTSFCWYGNLRSYPTFVSLPLEEMKKNIPAEHRSKIKSESDILKLYISNKNLDLKSVGLTKGIPIISSDTSKKLTKLAELATDDLTGFFRSIEGELKKFHKKSIWKNISYNEFFIWWYHFLYTEVTNHLIASNHIQYANKNFSYIEVNQ